MKKKSTSQTAFFNVRVLILIALFTGSTVAVLFAATEEGRTHRGETDPAGAAVGIDGTIYATIDGGATWIVRPSGTTAPLASVSFSNSNTGMARGADGTTLRTINSGATWTVQSEGTTKIPFAPQVDPIQLWVATYNGPANNYDDPAGVAVNPDGSRVFVTGGSYGVGTLYDWASIAYTATGGQLWVTRYNGLGNGNDTPQAAPVVSPDGSRIYVTGSVTLGDGTQTIRTAAYNATTGSQLW